MITLSLPPMTTQFHPTVVFLIFATIGHVLFGCNPVQDQTTSSLVPVGIAIEINDPDLQTLWNPSDGLDSPAILQILEHRAAFDYEVGRILHSATSWHEAHRALQTLLEREPDPRWPSVGRAYREQYVAGNMLHVEPLKLSTTPSALEATTFYTRLLIENHSPEATLIVDGLRRLAGYLAPEEHNALAARALIITEAQLARLVDCVDCSSLRLRETHPQLFQGASAHPHARLAVAAETLARMVYG
jgi:hypothetical protein